MLLSRVSDSMLLPWFLLVALTHLSAVESNGCVNGTVDLDLQANEVLSGESTRRVFEGSVNSNIDPLVGVTLTGNEKISILVLSSDLDNNSTLDPLVEKAVVLDIGSNELIPRELLIQFIGNLNVQDLVNIFKFQSSISGNYTVVALFYPQSNKNYTEHLGDQYPLYDIVNYTDVSQVDGDDAPVIFVTDQEDVTVSITKCEAVNGGVSQWSDWSVCTTTCGGGESVRSRACDNPTPQYYGADCTEDLIERVVCNSNSCPIDGGVGSWSPWNTCSATCGGGKTTRSRLCDTPAPQHGGADCTETLSEITDCNTDPCPIDGGVSLWSSWSACTVTCGGGQRSRGRSCDNPAPQHGGADCSETLSEIEMDCNVDPCPGETGVSGWLEWSACSTTCGGGQKERTRTCINPTNPGQGCSESLSQSISCNDNPCPIDGGVGQWSEWGSCSAICGGGQKTRERLCDTPAPQHGGADCSETLSETTDCNTDPCPIDGGVGQWTPWGPCSATCGGGEKSRGRLCDSPTPQYNGNDCSETLTEAIACNVDPCPIDGGVGQWSEWGNCSAICGGGQKTRDRICDTPAPQHGGADCSEILSETTDCNTDPCPIDGGVGQWTPWSPCSATCGGGEKSRGRLCDSPTPQYNGSDCSETLTEAIACNVDPCPTGVGPWTQWGDCSATCGGGIRYRSRVCNTDVCSENLTESDSCNNDLCLTAKCDGDSMTIEFTPVQPFSGLIHVGLDPDDTACQLEMSAGVNVTYNGTFPLDDSCDGTMETLDDRNDIVYKKMLFIQYNPLFVLPTDPIYNVTCTHNSQSTIINIYTAHSKPGGGQISGGEIGEVYAPVRLAVRSYPELESISGSLRLGQKVYLFSYLADSQVYSSILVDKCTATDPERNLTITIIEDSCPASNVGELFHAHPISRISEGKSGVAMLMEIFKLDPKTRRVRFSCEVKMCKNDNNCKLRYCPGYELNRRKRHASSQIQQETDESQGFADRQKRQAIGYDDLLVTNDKQIVETIIFITEQDDLTGGNTGTSSGNSLQDRVSTLIMIIALFTVCII